MTRNQIEYLKLLETKRQNQAVNEINRGSLEVEMSKASESARHNLAAENAALLELGIRSRATDIEQQKANANDMNAATNLRNAVTNERNATVNERNAGTNWYNAQSQRAQAQASLSQAEAASRQAAASETNAQARVAELKEQIRHSLVEEERKEREAQSAITKQSSEVDLNNARANESAARTTNLEASTGKLIADTNLSNAKAATEWQDFILRPGQEARAWLDTVNKGLGNLGSLAKYIPMN